MIALLIFLFIFALAGAYIVWGSFQLEDSYMECFYLVFGLLCMSPFFVQLLKFISGE